MKKDSHKTKVQFLMNCETFEKLGFADSEGLKESGIYNDLFAFFPDEKYNSDPNMFTSYSHIGQHSGCHLDYAKESRDATPEEYNALKLELESLGYNLEIVTNQLTLKV